MSDDASETMPPTPHWTEGPARWVAAIILGAACLAGLGWSIFNDPPAAGYPVQRAQPVASEASRTAPGGALVEAAQPESDSYAQRIDLNTAGAAELQLLPGIGPALSARIIEDREANGPYKSVDDLMRVKGIGPRTVARLRDMARAQ